MQFSALWQILLSYLNHVKILCNTLKTVRLCRQSNHPDIAVTRNVMKKLTCNWFKPHRKKTELQFDHMSTLKKKRERGGEEGKIEETEKNRER